MHRHRKLGLGPRPLLFSGQGRSWESHTMRSMVSRCGPPGVLAHQDVFTHKPPSRAGQFAPSYLEGASNQAPPSHWLPMNAVGALTWCTLFRIDQGASKTLLYAWADSPCSQACLAMATDVERRSVGFGFSFAHAPLGCLYRPSTDNPLFWGMVVSALFLSTTAKRNGFCPQSPLRLPHVFTHGVGQCKHMMNTSVADIWINNALCVECSLRRKRVGREAKISASLDPIVRASGGTGSM